MPGVEGRLAFVTPCEMGHGVVWESVADNLIWSTLHAVLWVDILPRWDTEVV